MDRLFLAEALAGDTIPTDLPTNFLHQVLEFEKLATGALVLTWCAVVAVKFSYLFLFRKLIDRLHYMMIYWWVAAVFNGIISIYGLIIYAAIRPWYCTANSGKCNCLLSTPLLYDKIRVDPFELVQCLHGESLDRSFAFAVSQMVLDILGDLLSK